MPKFINDLAIAECDTCGYQWQLGKNGAHSCIEALKAKVAMLEHRFAKLYAVSDEESVEGYRHLTVDYDKKDCGVFIQNADGRDITWCCDLDKTPNEQFIAAIDMLPEPKT